jgi:hypothetical protein
MRHCFTVLCLMVFALTFPSNSAFSQNLKFTEHDTTAGAGPIQLVRADFNNDTIPDLAVLNRDSKSISVFILNSDGTFRSHVDVLIGFIPNVIAVGDFNHDHIVDLVTSNQDDATQNHTLSVFLGHGDGTFADPKFIDAGHNPTGLAVGDFNGDGNLDVVTAWVGVTGDGSTATAPNFVAVSYGNGKGGFTDIQLISDVGDPGEPGENNRLIQKVTVGDFNRDGWPDIAFSETNGGFDVELGDIFVLLNKGLHEGNTINSFSDAQPPIEISVPVDIATSDINQDGFDDILVTFSGCHTPCLGVEYERSNGDGTFTRVPVAQFPDDQFGIPYGPSAGDVNEDGLKDIVVAVTSLISNHVQLSVSLQKPDGTFTFPPTFIDTNRGGTNFLSSVTADFNKDGRLDMALSSEDGVSTVINTTTLRGCPAPNGLRGLHICQPGNTSGGSPVQLLASTRDTLPIEAIRIYVDGVAKFLTTDDLLSARLTLPPGNHHLQVKAWDRLGSFAQTVNYTVASGCVIPGIDRTVKLCSPRNGSSVTGPVHLQAALSDSGNINSIQIYVDGVVKSTVAPANNLDTSLDLPLGTHRITVKAWDSVGQFSQTVNVTVN